MPSRRVTRLVLAGVVALSLLVLVTGYVTGDVLGGDQIQGDQAAEEAFKSGNGAPVVGPRENITVVSGDSNAFVNDDGPGPRQQAELAAFDRDGSVYYYNNSHTRYWDVDPVPGTRTTVEYLYSDHLSADECAAETVCTRNGIERVNLTTGEVTPIYDRITPDKHSTRWHDADRIDENRYLVADIHQDRVFIVNTETELIEWEWDAQTDYDTDSGGPYPSDWTHLNDVEHVEIDGREVVMVSLRNQDSVVFIDVERGLMEDWTLGEDGDHDTLYEQHNPDYIPPENGGPAVLVADSENSRIVEYQRVDGGWEKSWEWSDPRMQWARDADRLPNGHTLISDSNGDRVFEIDENGEVVWNADVGFPYEAERLGTGDESAGGPSAASIDLPSRTASDGSADEVGPVGAAWLQVKAAVPSKLVNAIAYVIPRWMGSIELAALLGLLVGGGVWAAAEWRWRGFSVSVRSPVRFGRK
ncbi:arylsulfotransferase family protein [Halegenticoccus tardaugens]|uniref:arylsulfotransferase family protein n=1 Tax=Halegenticoccus tardaugens TaxID=2071624 RepID=UPI00100A9A5F|nr:arylsulfotransferase family protein [Halegenticoccus tardaugens]